MNILGLNAFHGDASAALLVDGQLAAAVEEERFNRIKHWAGLPVRAASWCVSMDGGQPVQHVAVSRNPKAHLLHKVWRVAANPWQIRTAAGRAANSIHVGRVKDQLAAAGVPEVRNAELHLVEHHRAHLASAFFCSPFEEAAVISIDGFGDFSSVMWGVGRGSHIDVLGCVRFPHSLGLFYTAFTQFLGFPKYGDEYKMMGLGAYGQPTLASKVRDLVQTEGDQIRLNLAYFRHHTEGVEMTWKGGEPALGLVYSPLLEEKFGPARAVRSDLGDRHMDIAASAQAVLEENYFALLNYVRKKTGLRTVCLAGGVALNCVANGQIFEKSDFRDAWIQPAAHDAGTSIGAALYVQHQILGHPRDFVMRHVYWGNQSSDAEIRRDLEASGAVSHALDEEELLQRTAREISEGRIVGWYQGRMEFGPRALGNRSILADPRRSDMKDTLNRRIKYREPFRPFCPSILAEKTGEYFETDYPSPYMVVAYRIRPEQRDRIPAVTHGDGTGRLQTVEKDVNPLYWKLISRFDELTGVPVLLNTSFNENEPIVSTPAQAIDCFLRTRMDVLAIGNHILYKTENEQLGQNRMAFSEAAS